MTTEHKAAVKEKIETLGLPFNEEIYKDIDAMMSSSTSQFDYLSKLSAALNEKPASDIIKQMENNKVTAIGCPQCGYRESAKTKEPIKEKWSIKKLFFWKKDK